MIRSSVAWLLAFIAVVLVPLSVTVMWAHDTLLDTKAYVATVAPLASDPSMTAELTNVITNELTDEVQRKVQATLPSIGANRAEQLLTQARPAIRVAVETALASDAFATAWREAQRTLHTEFMAFVRSGKSTLITQQGTTLLLNLQPVARRTIDIMAAQGYEPALLQGLTVRPYTIGTNGGLERARTYVQLADRRYGWLLVGTVLVVVAAIGIGRRRSRIAVVIAAGSALVAIVLLGLVRRGETLTGDSTPNPVVRDASTAAYRMLTAGLTTRMLVVLLIAAFVVVAVVGVSFVRRQQELADARRSLAE
jgi:hypothetical protein